MNPRAKRTVPSVKALRRLRGLVLQVTILTGCWLVVVKGDLGGLLGGSFDGESASTSDPHPSTSIHQSQTPPSCDDKFIFHTDTSLPATARTQPSNVDDGEDKLSSLLPSFTQQCYYLDVYDDEDDDNNRIDGICCHAIRNDDIISRHCGSDSMKLSTTMKISASDDVHHTTNTLPNITLAAAGAGSNDLTTMDPNEMTAVTTISILTATTREVYECVRSTSCSYSTTMLLVVGTGAGIVVVVNIIFWYRFVIAWNMISYTHRVDIALIHSTTAVMAEATTAAGTSTSESTSSLSTSPPSISVHRRVKEQIRSYLRQIQSVHLDNHMNKQSCCPICLNDFYENEVVTSCDGTAHNSSNNCFENTDDWWGLSSWWSWLWSLWCRTITGNNTTSSSSSDSSGITSGNSSNSGRGHYNGHARKKSGCGTWFHTNCLYEWLERSDSCPCCRTDMISRSSSNHYSNSSNVSNNVASNRGWMSDLSIFLGYAPH